MQQIDHINIVVCDMNTMVAFYEKVLLLQITLRARLEGDWIESIIGIRNAVADCVYLQPPSGPRIELLQYITPIGVTPPASGAANTQGIRHIAFRVADIEAEHARLTAAGIKFLSPPITVPLTNVTQLSGRKRLCYFHDPEGNLLELCEYQNA